MQNRKDLPERPLDFAAVSPELMVKLRKTAAARYMANQLMRAASSSGANYEEALCLGMRSRREKDDGR